MTTTREMGQLLGDLLSSVNKTVHLETYDGSVREGRLSGYVTRKLKVNGKDVDWPTHIELNGDSMDVILIEQIKTVNIF